jgi:hypothetical protein
MIFLCNRFHKLSPTIRIKKFFVGPHSLSHAPRPHITCHPPSRPFPQYLEHGSVPPLSIRNCLQSNDPLPRLICRLHLLPATFVCFKTAGSALAFTLPFPALIAPHTSVPIPISVQQCCFACSGGIFFPRYPLRRSDVRCPFAIFSSSEPPHPHFIRRRPNRFCHARWANSIHAAGRTRASLH